MKYYVAIADVHGEAKKLQVALNDCDEWIKRMRSDDRIRDVDDVQFVFTGDLIDRGPDSKKVVEIVKSRVDAGAVCLMGNHDMFLVGTVEGTAVKFNDDIHEKHVYNSDLWDANDGLPTCIQMYGFLGDQYFRQVPSVKGYIDVMKNDWMYGFLKDRPVKYETPLIFFSHAPQSDPKDYSDSDLYWGRAKDYSKPDSIFKVPGNKLMSVHGHFHRLYERITFPRIVNYIHSGINKTVVLADSGCGYVGGALHPVIVSEMLKEETGRNEVRIEAIL